MDLISIMSEAPKPPHEYKELTEKLLGVIHSERPDVVLFNKLWEENGRPKLDFRRQIFSNHKLDGINLPGFNLEGSDFQQASLKDANLERVILKKAKLEKADLSRANLKEADLSNAYAPFSHLKGAFLDHAKLAGTELSVANLDRTNLEYANLRDANLSNATLRNSSLKGAILNSTKLEGAIIIDASELPISEDAARERGAILYEEPGELNPEIRSTGLTILEPDYFERHSNVEGDFENWKKGFAFSLPSIYYGYDFRREAIINDIKEKLETYNKLLLVAGTGSSKSTILMEIMCDYFRKGYTVLHNLDRIQLAQANDIVQSIEGIVKGKNKVLIAIDDVHDKGISTIFYVIDQLSFIDSSNELLFLLTARVPDYDILVSNKLNELGDEERIALEKINKSTHFKYSIPNMSKEEIKQFLTFYKTKYDIKRTTTKSYSDILNETGGSPTMLKFFLLGEQISPEIETSNILSGPSTHVITDRWTTEDTLGYGLYAHAIARFITHQKTVPPLCVSIQAPWGQGKTSLMRMIQQELDPDAVKELLMETPDTQLRRKFEQNKINLKQLVNVNNQDQSKDSPSYVSKVKHWYVSRTKRSFLNVEEIVKTELEKPTVFESLKVEGNKEQEVKPCFTVWYNAWSYESTEQVWSGLADSIVQQVAERLDPDESMRFLLGLNIRRYGKAKVEQKINDLVSAKWWQNILPSIKKYLPIIGISLVITTLGWIDKNQYWPIAGLTGLIGSLIASGLQIMQELSRARLSVQNDSAQQTLGEFVDVPDYTKGSVYMSHVIEDIQSIINRIPHEDTNNKVTNKKDNRNYLPIIIFIDDLDRCSPNKVTDIIEAINLFLGGGYFSNCIFVIGMDAEMVAAALEESYSKVIAKLPRYPSHLATGWRFMDKFVQLPFVIPAPEMGTIRDYVKKLFLQEEVPDKKLKEMQVKEAAKEVTKELIEPGKKNEKVELKQNVKIEENNEITKVAEKHGLTTKEDQELLKYEIQDRQDKQDLNRKINRFSFEDPEIRKIILDITPEFSGNPREVKRFMNVFRFSYFLLSARQTKGLGILSLEQLSRWIVITLKWPSMSRWLQGNVHGFEKLEVFGRMCKDYIAWRKKIETDLMLHNDTFPEIFDEEVFFFFRREGKEIKKEEKLSSGSGKGMY
jgi:KAP family P-loop domain/Pentapeptide repeats (8 copies)/Pentapeptide repeats (9 copies)